MGLSKCNGVVTWPTLSQCNATVIIPILLFATFLAGFKDLLVQM